MVGDCMRFDLRANLEAHGARGARRKTFPTTLLIGWPCLRCTPRPVRVCGPGGQAAPPCTWSGGGGGVHTCGGGGAPPCVYAVLYHSLRAVLHGTVLRTTPPRVRRAALHSQVHYAASCVPYYTALCVLRRTALCCAMHCVLRCAALHSVVPCTALRVQHNAEGPPPTMMHAHTRWKDWVSTPVLRARMESMEGLVSVQPTCPITPGGVMGGAAPAAPKLQRMYHGLCGLCFAAAATSRHYAVSPLPFTNRGVMGVQL